MNPNVLRQLTDARERATAYSRVLPCKIVVYLFRPVGCVEYCGAALGIYLNDVPEGPWLMDGYIGEPVMSFQACESP